MQSPYLTRHLMSRSLVIFAKMTKAECWIVTTLTAGGSGSGPWTQ